MSDFELKAIRDWWQNAREDMLEMVQARPALFVKVVSKSIADLLSEVERLRAALKAATISSRAG